MVGPFCVLEIYSPLFYIVDWPFLPTKLCVKLQEPHSHISVNSCNQGPTPYEGPPLSVASGITWKTVQDESAESSIDLRRCVVHVYL